MAMTTSDVQTSSHHAGQAAMALGVTSATLSAVAWAWDHRYVPLLFAAAPIVAVAGLAFAAIALRGNLRAAVPAFIGGVLSLVVLLGYAYALWAYVGGGD
jgi:hypothetical protein